MEKDSNELLISHGRSECKCNPTKVILTNKNTMGKFATVVFTHNPMM